MPRWLVVLLILILLIGSLIIIIKIGIPRLDRDKEKKKPKPSPFPIKIRNKTGSLTPTPSPTPTPAPSPTISPSSSGSEGLSAPGYIDCEWRGNRVTYHVTMTVVGSEGETIMEQDVEWRKNKEYFVDGKKIVNMTWTKEADYTIISKGGTLEFHVSETSDELWEGCEVIQWIHHVYGPGGEKIEQGNSKPTPGLSFIGFYNLTSNPLVATSEETVSVGDKLYHCWVYETTAASGPINVEVMFWFSPDAPVCGLVKATVRETHPGGHMEMTIVLTGSG